ncbi:hypothetical protein Dda_6014 [Drechslerella dactyloides]|uniref:Uncharacterized protein n=1 Tax=Drechslerella dactyloides TaxID=74499 RepID=A0AAD6NI70_DREDA|nr:hypothetical protein Dda_6014 [Drechslerella dactyloides]
MADRHDLLVGPLWSRVMEFFTSWPLLYRFLFAVCMLVVVLCIISATVRFINGRRTRTIESQAQQELLARPPASQLRRTSSVNFGVRALDSNETPAEAGIVDSESLRALSPASRWSRVSSPLSSGGRVNSGSTFGSIAEGTSSEQDGLLHPPRPPFVNHGRFSMTRSPPSTPQSPEGNSVLGPSSSPGYISARPLSAQSPGAPTSTASYGHTRSASYTQGFNDDNSAPYRYLRVPSTSPRPASAGAASSNTNSLYLRPTPSARPLKGILKNRTAGQSYYAGQLDTKRASTPNTVFGVSPPNNKEPYSPELPPSDPDLTDLRSATPVPKSRQGYIPLHNPHNLSDIPEAEGQDNMELKERRTVKIVENIPVAKAMGSYAIPQSTRAPPSLPFMQSPSPATSAVTPEPQGTAAAMGSTVHSTMPKQNGTLEPAPNTMI